MTTKTYIDCGSGVAGDMFLGALIGLGLSPRELERALQAALKTKSWRIKTARVERQSWPAWSLNVEGDRWFGSLDQMISRVNASALPAPVKDTSRKIFSSLKNAERQAHGAGHSGKVEELGFIDTFVDTVGAAWGVWKLGIADAEASPLNTGRIAPATAALLKDSKLPVYSENIERELATPTGVAILLNVARKFTRMGEMQIHKTGYGAGTYDRPGKPNVLAIYQGTLLQARGSMLDGTSSPGARSLEPGAEYPQDSVLLLETVIDDMDPRLYPHVSDLLFKTGALDVWWAAIGMKKGRPGIAFSVLARPQDEAKLLRVLFHETTTLGIRRVPLQRWVLPRAALGRDKVAALPGGASKRQVEYEIARKTALADAVPLRKLLK